MVKCQGSTVDSGYGGKMEPTRETVCWHCVWTLWTMLSQTVRGYEPINHSVIGPTPVIIHPKPLILSKTPLASLLTCSLPGFCPWEFATAVFLQKVYLLNWIECSFSVQHDCNPEQRWKRPRIFMKLKQLCWHKHLSKYFKLSCWRMKTAHTVNLACAGRHTSAAEGIGGPVGKICFYVLCDSRNWKHPGFFQCVNGKSSEAYGTVSAGQSTCLDLSPTNLPRRPHRTQHHTEQRTEDWCQSNRERL